MCWTIARRLARLEGIEVCTLACWDGVEGSEFIGWVMVHIHVTSGCQGLCLACSAHPGANGGRQGQHWPVLGMPMLVESFEGCAGLQCTCQHGGMVSRDVACTKAQWDGIKGHGLHADRDQGLWCTDQHKLRAVQGWGMHTSAGDRGREMQRGLGAVQHTAMASKDTVGPNAHTGAVRGHHWMLQSCSGVIGCCKVCSNATGSGLTLRGHNRARQVGLPTWVIVMVEEQQQQPRKTEPLA